MTRRGGPPNDTAHAAYCPPSLTTCSDACDVAPGRQQQVVGEIIVRHRRPERDSSLVIGEIEPAHVERRASLTVALLLQQQRVQRGCTRRVENHVRVEWLAIVDQHGDGPVACSFC